MHGNERKGTETGLCKPGTVFPSRRVASCKPVIHCKTFSDVSHQLLKTRTNRRQCFQKGRRNKEILLLSPQECVLSFDRSMLQTMPHRRDGCKDAKSWIARTFRSALRCQDTAVEDVGIGLSVVRKTVALETYSTSLKKKAVPLWRFRCCLSKLYVPGICDFLSTALWEINVCDFDTGEDGWWAPSDNRLEANGHKCSPRTYRPVNPRNKNIRLS